MRPRAGGNLGTFFLLTFAVMWACFLTVAATGSARTPWGTALLLLGAYSPSLVAVGLSARGAGGEGVRALLGGVLPQFFVPDTPTHGQSFPVFVVQVTALSVAMCWLWARSQGSLLPVMLMHSAVNNAPPSGRRCRAPPTP